MLNREGTDLEVLVAFSANFSTRIMALWQMPAQHSFWNLPVMTLPLQDLDGLVAVPSLSHPHFMEAHYLATQVRELYRYLYIGIYGYGHGSKLGSVLVGLSSLGLIFCAIDIAMTYYVMYDNT